jgi:hypothetical protein
MNLEVLRAVLGWCTVINLGLLIWWFLCFVLAHDLTYRVHNRCFKVTVHEFNLMHYAGMGLFKIGIMLLNLGPYIALRLAGA